MTAQSHRRHIVGIIVTAVAAGLLELLGPSGPFVHAAWAPVAVIVINYARAFFGGDAAPPAVPPAAAVLLVLALSACSGCHTIMGPTPPPGTPGFVNCSDAAIHAAALNILPSVESALAVDGYEAKLETLIASLAGPLAIAEVECAVAWVEARAEASAPVTADSLEATKAAHARAWLAAHPVTFAVTP